MSPRKQDLEDLWERIREDSAFDHMRTPGIKLVPGEGPARPSIFVVGEAPGAFENTQGRPFVGVSGQVLTQLMALAGISREKQCWVTNVVKYRPPGNRTPSLFEQLAARPHLLDEWRIVGRPRLILAIGGTAHAAMHPQYPILNLSPLVCTPWELKDGLTTIVSMFHPAYGLRGGPKRQEQLERHWEQLPEELQRHGVGDLLD